jgi:hypothetical protein
VTEGRISIRYSAVRNARAGAGWLPQVWVNGRPSLSTWSPTGYDRGEAAHRARVCAEEEASHFVGDWTISIDEGQP